MSVPARPPVLILGAGGTLGRALARLCRARGLPHVALTRAQCGITDAAAVERTLAEVRPWAVANAAGWVRVDEAEADPEGCALANTEGPVVLAGACARHGARLLTFSTDLVFDGRLRRPYLEPDPVGPLNVYGRTKAEAERRVAAVLPSALVVRTSAFFGPWDDANFAVVTRDALARGEVVRAASDAWVSPTYVPDLAGACLDLLSEGAEGLRHLANAGALTWEGFARAVAEADGLDADRVEGVPVRELGLPARRPAYCALGTVHPRGLRPFEEALRDFTAAAPRPVSGTADRG